jgi:hypothetical protein
MVNVSCITTIMDLAIGALDGNRLLLRPSSFRNLDGNKDLHGKAWPSVTSLNSTAVHGYGAFSDGQSEPNSARVLVTVGVHSEKGLEQVLESGIRHTRAVVADFDPGVSILPLQSNSDFCVFGCIPNGIPQYVLESATEEFPVAQDLDIVLHRELNAAA